MPHPSTVSRRRLLKGFGAVTLGQGVTIAQSARAEPAAVKFALNRGPYDASNAPFLLARDKSWFAGEGLAVDLSLSKNVVDAIRRVASNECDFGYADFSVVMRFAADNPATAPHLLYSIFDRSPTAIVTWKTSGVRNVADLAGKTLAATPGDGAYQLFPAFCRANNIDPNSIKVLEVGLEKRGQIAGLLRAGARGWRASLANPADMFASLARANPNADMALEAERFEWIRNQQIHTANVKKNGMGTIDRARFEKLASFLVPQVRPEQLATIIESGFLPSLEERAV